MTKQIRTAMILGATLLASQLGFAATKRSDSPTARIEKDVRRELVMLPFYSLFDHFSFKVDGQTVTLAGKVSRPSLRSDAENVVKNVVGVENVSNQIEVLPLSSHDDRLRLALYQSIYGHGVLQNLSVRAVPPIHIIVENGNVTLEGAVANEMQKQIAGIQANGVAGVFSVTNNLRIDSDS